MKCPRCHREALIGAEYCIVCGTALYGDVHASGRPLSQPDGLPEIKRHMNEMADRLSKVEGRVTLISERMRLQPFSPQPAIGGIAEPPKVGLLQKTPVESVPAEAVSPKEASPAALAGPSSIENPPVSETKAVVGANAPFAVPKVPASPVVNESKTAGAIDAKPGQQSAESGASKPVIPELRASSPAAQQQVIRDLAVTPLPKDVETATPSAAQYPPARPVVSSGTAAAKPSANDTAAKPLAASTRPPQGPPKPRQPSQFAKRMRKWEEALPGNWLSRIGMVILLIGLGFLTQWAIATDKLVRLPLLLAGLACGGLLLLAGHHWKGQYGAWAQALTGGGIGVLYLSVFASFALYTDNPVMPFWATFLCMFLVTVLAVGIALRRDSMSIAIIGIVGAFLVPITLGAIRESDSSPVLIAAYVLTLDVGVVCLASRRNWRWFTLLGFVGSITIFSLWYWRSDRDSIMGQAEGMLTGIFLCFAAATTLFHGLQRHRPHLTDLALMTLNAAVYFGVSHYLLWEDGYQHWLGGLGFGLAAFYVVLGCLFLRRSKENRLLAAFAFGIATTFVTVAIPVQFEKSYMTAAWAAEGAVLIWLAVRFGTPRWQLWGLGAFALALVRLFAFDQFVDQANFTPIMNNMFWAFAPAALAFFAVAFLLRNREKALQPWFFPMMMLIGNFLAVWLFSFEVINFAGMRIHLAEGARVRELENARDLTLVALWSVYGLALAYWGTRKGWVWLRLGGYALVGTGVGATLVDLNYLHARITDGVSNPIANYSFGALAISVSVLGLIALVIRRYADKVTEGERACFPFIVSMANILTVYALSAEVFTFLHQPLNARNLVLVALWAAYGLGTMIVGLWRGWGWLRAQGWLLALMTIGMTLITLNYGHFLMEEGPAHPIGNYSFGAFAICIGVVGAFACLVSANQERLHRSEASGFPTLVSLAGILVLYALSAEVFAFLDEPLNARNLVTVALWSAYGLGMMTVGLWRGWGWLRAQGWVLALMAIGMSMITLNYGHLAMAQRPAHPIGNYSFAAFAICTVLVGALARIMAGNRKSLAANEANLFPALVLLGNFLALWAISSEVITFIRDSENARNLVLVLIWCVYGLGLLASGIWRKWDWLRVAGYLMVAVGVGATLVMLNHSAAGVRSGSGFMPIVNPSVGGFAVCVVALYLCGAATAWYREALQGFEKTVGIVALAAASVLTVWGISEEIVAFTEVENLRNLLLVMLWAGYGSLLMAVGVDRKALLPRIGGCVLLALATGATAMLLNHWLAWIRLGDDWPIVNYSFGAFAVCVLASYLFAWLTARLGDKAFGFDRVVRKAALAVANVLTIWALSGEVVTFLADSPNLRNLVLVIVWSAYGCLAMMAGTLKGAPAARFAGYALVAAGIGMTTTLLNHGQPGLQSSEYGAVFNPAFGGFVVCVIALYLLAYVMGRYSGKLLDGEKPVLTIVVLAANLLSLFALSSEVWTYAPSEEWRSMGLTMLWAGYGTVLIVAGILGKWPWVRVGGLALVSVAVLKLFILDTLGLDAGFRVGAYITVGVLLLAGGFVYHRYADVIKGFIMDRPEKGTGAARK